MSESTPEPAAGDLPIPAFRFEVLLEPDAPIAGVTGPVCRGAFASCEGLETTMEPLTLTPGGADRQVQLVAPVRHGQLVLRRGVSTDLTLWAWFEAAASPGSRVTAHGEVVLWSADGTPQISFQLEGVLPVRLRGPQLNAQDGLVATEEMTLAYGKLRVRAAGDGASGTAPGVELDVSGALTATVSVGNGPATGVLGAVPR